MRDTPLTWITDQMDQEKRDFKAMARRCGMGDVNAMFWMWKHLHGLVSEEARLLEERWLGDPSEENLSALGKYFEKEDRRQEYYRFIGAAFWLFRGAMYGSEEAAALVREHPERERLCVYKPNFQLPRIHGWKDRCCGFCRHTFYPEINSVIGLLDIAKNSGSSLLSAMDEKGFYRMEDYVGYEGPDESGFGMEEESDFSFYDEFFQFLFVLKGWSVRDVRNNQARIWTQCEEKRAEKQAERELFWKLNSRNREMKRYRAPRWPLAE